MVPLYGETLSDVKLLTSTETSFHSILLQIDRLHEYKFVVVLEL